MKTKQPERKIDELIKRTTWFNTMHRNFEKPVRWVALPVEFMNDWKVVIYDSRGDKVTIAVGANDKLSVKKDE